EWLGTVCGDRLGSSDFQQLEIIIAEAFTNTVKYAHAKLAASTPILLDLLLEPHHVEVRIWDKGEPFDLSTHLQAELGEIDVERSLHQEGHRGLLLMKRLSDDLFYETLHDRQNCLVMRKKIAAPKTSPR
ncbi:MAG: ATP-binding protein, partial [Synechocystis sp.]|nr:ATP-binding protein [Synechocystis sp.]